MSLFQPVLLSIGCAESKNESDCNTDSRDIDSTSTLAEQKSLDENIDRVLNAYSVVKLRDSLMWAKHFVQLIGDASEFAFEMHRIRQRDPHHKSLAFFEMMLEKMAVKFNSAPSSCGVQKQVEQTLTDELQPQFDTSCVEFSKRRSHILPISICALCLSVGDDLRPRTVLPNEFARHVTPRPEWAEQTVALCGKCTKKDRMAYESFAKQWKQRRTGHSHHCHVRERVGALAAVAVLLKRLMCFDYSENQVDGAPFQVPINPINQWHKVTRLLRRSWRDDVWITRVDICCLDGLQHDLVKAKMNSRSAYVVLRKVFVAFDTADRKSPKSPKQPTEHFIQIRPVGAVEEEFEAHLWK